MASNFGGGLIVSNNSLSTINGNISINKNASNGLARLEVNNTGNTSTCSQILMGTGNGSYAIYAAQSEGVPFESGLTPSTFQIYSYFPQGNTTGTNVLTIYPNGDISNRGNIFCGAGLFFPGTAGASTFYINQANNTDNTLRINRIGDNSSGLLYDTRYNTPASTYVPYTGAQQDLNMGTFNISTNGRITNTGGTDLYSNLWISQSGTTNNYVTYNTKSDGTYIDLGPLTTKVLNIIGGNVKTNGALQTANTTIGLNGDITTNGGITAPNTTIAQNGNITTNGILTAVNGIYVYNYGIDITGPITGKGDIYAVGNISGQDVTARSDVRLKSMISTIENPISTIMQMRGVSYYLNSTINSSTPVKKIGLIAQEVERVLPEVVITDTNPDGYKSVAYGNIVGLLVEAFKELSNKVDKLAAKII
jgi:hypothetical protein